MPGEFLVGPLSASNAYRAYSEFSDKYNESSQEYRDRYVLFARAERTLVEDGTVAALLLDAIVERDFSVEDILPKKHIDTM